MPKFLVKNKLYPSLIDIYTQRTMYDPDTGETVRDWDYLEYDTVECVIAAVNPEDSLEQFGPEYSDKKFVRVELAVGEWSLSQRAGNLRSKQGEYYYQSWNGQRYEQDLFNVSGLNTQLDIDGRIVGYELYLELAQ
ncbi:hypothetical protein QMK17_21540 [Rhodococcus sp. G-MC3]|uniref:hypothetical protein n=1 Tax=Rhodococcus sp. G-MC3 TaxID=3046209 RepID=UPI0024BB3522|nr:hypothetical protein [Rhodococcus sp. G-MC3]MDJ0395906.1 hypothetical protein [Rhodococcus sp. G-MC3]